MNILKFIIIALSTSLLAFIMFRKKDLEQSIPKSLYKIVSAEYWNTSQGKEKLRLSKMDAEFIHLATKKQIDRIAKKFFVDIPVFYILQLDPKKLPGTLKFEVNPGGRTKFYHLYNGSIPMTSIIEAKKITNTLKQ